MKSGFYLFMFILSLYSCVFKSQVNSKEEEYKLVWEENFSTSSLDETTWSKIPRGTPDWKNYMSDFEGCYDFRDNNLVLLGIKNRPEYNLNDTAQFLTGGVYTKGRSEERRVGKEGKPQVREQQQG